MRIETFGKDVEVTPALRDYVQDKLARVARHFDHHLDTRVILSVDKLDQKAEATLSTPGKTLHAEAIAPDMYAAIDLLADKLDRMAIKLKEAGFTDFFIAEQADTLRTALDQEPTRLPEPQGAEAHAARDVRDTPQVRLVDPPQFVLKGRQVLLKAAVAALEECLLFVVPLVVGVNLLLYTPL